MTQQDNATPRQTALEAARSRLRRPVLAGEAVRSSRSAPIAFAYLRVSTKEQARTGGGAEGYSIPAQRAACHAKATQLGAVIEPEHEYVDAGESARSADRERLQQMLKDVKTVRPDYVIVHKIDRLARNREDDIAINLLLRKHGVKLISCSENIDDTPTGRLLYGVMAELAQFYSGNLAQEVMKGLLRKAEEGGTPFRAPLGYINRREAQGKIEYSWVELDQQRAEIVAWCFRQYATGELSALDLTLAAQAKGLTARPTATRPAEPISLNSMYSILKNPYYMGIVSYQGIHYEGKHPALVEPDVWLAVQNVLAAHANRGERDHKHPHYLRSTIYCSACGGRLVYSENTGNGGTYKYYFCVKRKTKTNNCTRPAVRVERIEDGIADFYRQFQVKPEYAEQIRQGVRAELATQQQDAERSLKRALARKQQVKDERQKLLQAHYTGAIPADLLASEMKRFTRELADADAEIQAAKATNADVEATLALALNAAAHCEVAYLSAPDAMRRQINQGFFERLLIGDDGSVERAELTEPFRLLLEGARALTYEADAKASQITSEATNLPGCDIASVERSLPSSVFVATYGTAGGDLYMGTECDETNTHRRISPTVRGVNNGVLVGDTGIEPVTSSV
jgi:site-specific DNA recombinase